MSKLTAAITGVGSFLPEYTLTNQELETMVDTNDEWIVTRTGIKERRILKGDNKGAGYMGIKASQDLLSKTGKSSADIDLVILASVTPDMPVAITSAYIATEIGATKAFSIDLQAACSSFLYGMSIARAYIESGQYRKVLVVGSDKMSSIINYEDRQTCIIFGDGAGAVLMEPNEDGYGFKDEVLRTDAVGRQFLNIQAGGSLMPASEYTVQNNLHYVYQDGRSVFKYAVANMADVSAEIMKRNDLTNTDVNWLVPHQANKRIIDATAKRMNIVEDKVMMNIHKYGNTTSATLPLLLSDYESKLSKGDKLIFSTFGGGFTWGSMYLTWAYDTN